MKAKSFRSSEPKRVSPGQGIAVREPESAAFAGLVAEVRRTQFPWRAGLVWLLGLVECLPAMGATLLVWPGSPSPTPPYAAWTNAAWTIQDAVDAAQAGDTVLVTNGLYAAGGRVVYGALTNRLAVDRALVVRSVNGPGVTAIQGYQVPGTANGDGAIRCAYLTNGAVLSGFTLTNGATLGGGEWYQEQSGGGVWCEDTTALVTNCVLTGNAAVQYGGGAYQGTLNHCTLVGNSAGADGGGAFSSTLNACTLTGNSSGYGGGAWSSSLTNCTLTGNSAKYGGGANLGTLDNCIITGNSASTSGGGVFQVMVNNCLLTDNTAAEQGGGAQYCTLNNCTLTGNSVPGMVGVGGGAYGSTLNNCVVYYNTAYSAPNYYGSGLDHCCTTPLPSSGSGNITAEPQLASLSHLSAMSPCCGAGSADNATGVDIDGEAWLAPPSIGCDEYRTGAVTGVLTVAIAASWTNVAVGFAVDLTGTINGRVSASVWDFGDGTVISNRSCVSHTWGAVGNYPVVLRAYNESYPGGVSATVTVRVSAPVHYVSGTSTNPVPPYSAWETAATTIQAAVDEATLPGALVLVTNGLYATGGWAVFGMLTNRVAVDRPLVVRSVNGPGVTVIQGYQVPGTVNGDEAIRCVYLTNGAVLSGFTLTNGATRAAGAAREVNGGGVWCEPINAVVTNCTIAGNSASGFGGGVCFGTVNNCALIGNSAEAGGGAADSTLNNCTLTANSASFGGGAHYSILSNCTLSGNSSSMYGGGIYKGTLNNSTLTSNRAVFGGGAYEGTLNNCMIADNSASKFGGGACSCLLNNCTLTGNSVPGIHGNGGGVYGGTLNNCVVYYNTANTGPNYSSGAYFWLALNYCCTTPLPASGISNIIAEPQLASASHISPTSPCRGAGSAAYATGVDIDGEPWLSPPSIGCDESRTGTGTGEFTVGITASWTNVVVGYAMDLMGLVNGRVVASMWDFGDGTVLSNRPYASHAWATAGDYAVVLRAYNDSHPEGVSATVTIRVLTQAVYYASATSTNPVAPYSSWETAATNIQAAVDATTVLGALVLVNDGVYATGGRVAGGALTNRVAVTCPLVVQSVHGPDVTIIQGYQVPGTTNGDGAVRCVYLANGAVLNGFTLTNGATRATGDSVLEESGGGVWCESTSAVVTNCTLTGNSARMYGGGAYQGTLTNCALTGNNSPNIGGGASHCTLNNCTLAGNSAGPCGSGGGADSSTLNDCQLTGNSADNGGGVSLSTLNRCTLAGNSAITHGGGADSSTLNNCTLAGNSLTGAYGSASGGGAYNSTLTNCTLTGNKVTGPYASGGGAFLGVLINCTLTSNSASVYGGGACYGTLKNCILYYNTASSGLNYSNGLLSYCCTTPLPGSKVGISNITAEPLFVDRLNGNLRLLSNSPCINAGANAYVSGTTDRDGRPRIVGGTVDIGAYEFQEPALSLFIPWLAQNDLPTDGSADYTDPDGDGANNWQEYLAGRNPLVWDKLRCAVCQYPKGGAFQLEAYGEIGCSYVLQASTNLADWAPMLAFTCTNAPTTLVDAASRNYGRRFYRIGPLSSLPRPQLGLGSARTPGSNGLDLLLLCCPGLNYRIEASSNLSNWETLTNFTSTNATMCFRDSSATNSHRRFYRAIVP